MPWPFTVARREIASLRKTSRTRTTMWRQLTILSHSREDLILDHLWVIYEPTHCPRNRAYNHSEPIIVALKPMLNSALDHRAIGMLAHLAWFSYIQRGFTSTFRPGDAILTRNRWEGLDLTSALGAERKTSSSPRPCHSYRPAITGSINVAGWRHRAGDLWLLNSATHQ